MDDDAYELVAHEDVEKLKREIERLKSNPFIQNSTDDKLYDSIKSLNDSVNKLYSLFENINRQLMKEYQSGESPEEKIDIILEQNKSIAEALVAFSAKFDNMNAQNSAMQKEMIKNMSKSNNQPLNNQPQMAMPPQQLSQVQPQMQSMNESEMQNTQNQFQTPIPRPPAQQMNQYQDPFANGYGNSQMQEMQGLPPLQPPQGYPTQGLPPLQPPIQRQGPDGKITYTSIVDPNYPVPDRFQGLNSQPSIGAPLDVAPHQKKKGLFGLGRN